MAWRKQIVRATGGLMFCVCCWWAHRWATEVATVSPVHWPLLLPQLVTVAIPACLSVALAATLVVNPSRALPLALLLCLSAIQAVIVMAATPQIPSQYVETVRESQQSWHTPALD